MLILIEGIVFCFIMLIYCVIGIANGPEKFTVFYEPDVQQRAIELGYTTRKQIKRQFLTALLVLYVPCFTLVPYMVYVINGARTFWDLFLQSYAILMIAGLFDRFFIDMYWVDHTKAWDIKGTEDLKPYIPRKAMIGKWVGTIVGFLLTALLTSWLLTLI